MVWTRTKRHIQRAACSHIHLILICVSLTRGIVYLSPSVSCSLFCHTSFFSRPDTHLWIPLNAKLGRLIDCMCQCVFACLKDTVITVYVMCPAVLQYSLPRWLPSTLSFFISVYVPLSWQQWHIEGTAFWVVNLMELLTCGAVWINMAWRLLSQGRSIITTTQQTRENRCQC